MKTQRYVKVRHYKDVSGQFDVPAAAPPPKKEPLTPSEKKSVWAPEPVWFNIY